MGVSRTNALGLLSIGGTLWALPDFQPGWFPGDGWDGTNSQALWLYAVGGITAAFGVFYLIKTVIIPLFWSWAIFRPPAEGVKAASPPAAKSEPAAERPGPVEHPASVPVPAHRLVA